MWVTFERAERLGPQSSLFFFKPEGRYRYTAGQFAELQITHDRMDNRGDLRWFTLTSAPHEALLSIAVKFPGRGSTYKQALRSIKPGARLHLSDPLGDFVLPKVPSVPMIWLAGGIGAASYVAMAKELARHRDERPLMLFQTARHSDDLAFSNYWQMANIPMHQTVTGPDDSWQGRTARFSVDDLLRAVMPHKRDETLFYLSGSTAMVDGLADALVFCGIQPQQIVREAFTGY